ncbi:T-type calcium channel subunit alpha-1H [Seminavis robusta]|uniref:T-type calcium channel subunit alpha-1H n=1 Tax=Seminavis robusta TaxID=568900 RepID=A0A9N8H9E7_9STRA|nr:T-type calcium channel subunit alpha-1H [Seminavis robusta]|eukprot:Sro115_g056810.1 T-type calcium channel subunit alpha-1H (1130) ;mRNA; f:66957-70346
MPSYFDNLRDEEYHPSGSRSRSRSRNTCNDGSDQEYLDESYDRFSDEPDSRDSGGRGPQAPYTSSSTSREYGTTTTTSNKKKKKKKKPSQTSSSDEHDYTSSTTSAMSYSRSSSSNPNNNNGGNDIYAAYTKNKEKKNDLFEAYRKLAVIHTGNPNSNGRASTTITRSTTTGSGNQTTITSNHDEEEHASASTQLSTEEEEHSQLQHSTEPLHKGPTNMRIDTSANNSSAATSSKKKQKQTKQKTPPSSTSSSTLAPDYGAPEFPPPTAATAAPPKTKRKTIKKKASTVSTASRSGTGGKSPSPVLQRPQEPTQQQDDDTLLHSSHSGPNNNNNNTTKKKKKKQTKQQQQPKPQDPPTSPPKPTHYVRVTDYEQPKRPSKAQSQQHLLHDTSNSTPPPQIYAPAQQDNSNNQSPIPPLAKIEDESSRNTGPVIPPHPPLGVVHSPVKTPHPPSQIRWASNSYQYQSQQSMTHQQQHPPIGMVEQAPPRLRGPQESVSTIDNEDLASLDPKNFQLKSSLDRGSIKDVAHYSRRMDVVKENLRRNITIEEPSEKSGIDNSKNKEKRKTVKRGVKKDSSRKSVADDASSSESSKSSKGGIMAFLSTFKGHPKARERDHLTESERRARDNPFLNRPTGIKLSNTVGLHKKERKGHDLDGSSRSGSSSSRSRSMATHSLAGTSYSSYEKTLQEKYCPLPTPVKKIQQFCGKIVTNTNFQVFMIFLIMLNALVLGIATYEFENPKVPEVLDYIDKVLLVIFTVELALQFGYCGVTLFLDGWLVFDTLTVVTSWWLEGVQVFRSFRIFRSFRLIVRLPLLKNLVLTVFHVMPRIYSILGLLLLILYVYGVLCTILFGDMYELGLTDKNYFSRLDYSVFTLFQMVTLEGWGDIVRQVRAVHSSIATMIFSSFIIFTGFIMYNLIVAVMCDSMLVIEAQGREEIRQQQQEKKRLAESAKEEEEKRIIDEMLRQRKEDGIRRRRLLGLVGEDSTVSYHESTTHRSGHEHDEPSWEHMSDVEEEEEEDEDEIEWREVMCEHCEGFFEIHKYPPSVRRRNMLRDELMAKNQERIGQLQQKVAQMAETQQRVTAVLQTLMHEIEASRMRAMNDGSAMMLMGDTSIGEDTHNEEERVRLGKDQ